MIGSLFFTVVLRYLFLNTFYVQGRIFPCNRTAACGCSQRDADITARIVGGELAANNSWGWAVSIRYLGQPICGGAILSDRFVITAAHCVFGNELSPEEFSIFAGANRRNSTEGQTHSPARIYPHPDYNERTNANDIAILDLSTSVTFGDPHVSKLCLPIVSNAEELQYPYVHRPVVAIGWGTTSSRGNESVDLRQVTINTIPNNDSTCQSVIRRPDIQFCAGVNGGGKDTCQGDSGGPVMSYSEKDQLWMLVGITSYGRGCGLPDTAGVYTRVSKYIDWIRSLVGPEGVVTIPQTLMDTTTPRSAAQRDQLPVDLLLFALLILSALLHLCRG